MNIWMPLHIERINEDTYEGFIPFMEEFRAQGITKESVARQLAVPAKRLFFSRRNLDFYNEMVAYRGTEDTDYVSVPFFTRAEDHIFLFLSFWVSLPLYIVLSLIGLVFYYVFFSHMGATIVTGEVYNTFVEHSLNASYISAFVYIVFWNWYYIVVYPALTSALAGSILHSQDFGDAYHSVIGRWVLPSKGGKMAMDYDGWFHLNEFYLNEMKEGHFVFKTSIKNQCFEVDDLSSALSEFSDRVYSYSQFIASPMGLLMNNDKLPVSVFVVKDRLRIKLLDNFFYVLTAMYIVVQMIDVVALSEIMYLQGQWITIQQWYVGFVYAMTQSVQAFMPIALGRFRDVMPLYFIFATPLFLTPVVIVYWYTKPLLSWLPSALWSATFGIYFADDDLEESDS